MLVERKPRTERLQCAMVTACTNPVTHIGKNGHVYCFVHGPDMRYMGTPCRKLTIGEHQRLLNGEPLEEY